MSWGKHPFRCTRPEGDSWFRVQTEKGWCGWRVDAELHRFAGTEMRSAANRPERAQSAFDCVRFRQDWGRRLPAYLLMKELT